MLEELITSYGYIAIFIGTFLEGETILVVGGYLAHQGHLKLEFVIATAFIGTLAGDQLFYFIGRKKGMSILENRPRWKEKSQYIMDQLHKHQVLLIVGFRFLYGIRNVTPFLIGASGISPRVFIPLNFIGALVWAIAVGVLGYLVGNAVELFLDKAKQYQLIIILSLIGIGAVMWLWRSLKTKKEIKS
ncbi:MAG: DedA family protein [Campylobacterales bacterium]|nr:DedA family protein [Campylobacterales bacterium]